MKKSSEAQLKAYHRYMTNVAVLLGANPQTAAEEFNRVINLEKQLANVRLSYIYDTTDNLLISDRSICGCTSLQKKLRIILNDHLIQTEWK